MNMKRYDTYKPTGIDWIGEVPETWHLSKMKYIAQYINGYAFKPTDWTDSGLPIIRIQDLTGTNDNPNYYDGQIPNKYLIKNGDVLISWAATLDSFVWDRGDAWLNQHIFKTVVNESEVDKRYFVWLSKVAMSNMNNENKHGIMMEHVTSDIFDNYCIPIPPLSEQSKIAAYLDERCAGIDKVLATQEKRIALLQELKQSEITQAVTRGLNPEARMKDSGVEWIGMVPEHWEVLQLRRFAKIYTGSTPPTNRKDYYDSEDVLWYTPSDFTYETYRLGDSERKISSKAAKEFVGELFPKNTILMTGIGLVGKIGITPDACYSNQQINAIVVDKKQSVGFVAYYLKGIKDIILSLPKASLLPILNQSETKQIIVALPPIDEQIAIAEHLDRRCGEIDKQIGAVTKQIELLREYKQALITEVVTGKRKV